MMESQVQPQESWTTASDKVTIPSSDATSPSWNGTGSVDSTVIKEDGTIHTFTDSMQTMSRFLETETAKDSAGLPSEEDPVQDQLSLAEASSDLNHSGTERSGDAAQPVDGGKEGLLCGKTVTSPDSKALPDDVVTSHNPEPVRTQGGEGNGCDASGMEPMETEESDSSEGKEASDTVLDLKARSGDEQEDGLTASEPADRKASDDGSHGDEAVAHSDEAVSHSGVAVSDEAVSQGGDLVSLTVTGEAGMGSAEVGASPRREQLDQPVTGTEDGESDSVSASATSCADNSRSDRARSPPVENSVNAQGGVGSEEKGDDDKEEDVSDGHSEVAQSIAGAQNEEEPTGQPAHCTDTTQSPPQSPDDAAARSSPKGSLPSETCRTDNIFEKFSSFGDLQSNATPPFGSKDVSQVEEDGGKSSTSEPLLDLGDGQRCSEAPSDQMSSLTENQDDKEHPDDDSTAKDDQHNTDCRRVHVGEDISDVADEDTHLKTQADTDGASDEAFGQNRGESPEPCEEKVDGDNEGETSDVEMGEDRDNVGNITESSHHGQSPTPSPQDALTTAGSEVTKSEDRLNADQKDVCSDVSLSSHTSNQKTEAETENVSDTPPRPGSETDHSDGKSVEAENHPEQRSEDHQRDESTSQSQQKADTESPPKTTTQATSIDSNPVSNENDDKYEDDEEENGNEGDGSTDFMKDETLFDMEERGTKEEDSTSVQEDSSLEKKEGDDVLKDGDDKKHEDNESDLPASDNEDSPDTPRFQLARTKTVKTYSRKVESKALTLHGTASAEVTGDSAAENQATPTGPNDSDSADGEESCSLKSDQGSPIIESAPSDSEEGSMNNDKLSGSKDQSLPYDESLMEDPPPPPSKPLIVSRITKALSSVPRDQDRKAGKFVLKLKPLAPSSEARQSQDRDARGESMPRTPAHTCDLCGKTFSMPGRLQRHKRHHQAGKHFYCDVCGKSFVDQEKLDFHHKVHTQSVDRDFTCDQCGHVCKNWRSFVYHSQTHSGDGRKKHSCELCGHTLSSVQRLKRHMVHHKKGLHFCCFGCGKLFKTQDDLDRHSVKHKLSTPLHPHPVAKPVPVPTPLFAATTATLLSTPVSRKRAAESVDEDQPPAKRSAAVVRATHIQVSQAERDKTAVTQSPDLSEKEEEEDWGSLEDTTSGTSTPAGGVQSTWPGSDGGRLRKSSRKRSHSRKKCSCCPSSPTPMASPSSGHVRHSKEDSGQRPVEIDAEGNPEKKRKIASDIEGPAKKKKKKKVRSDAEGLSEKKKKVSSDSESSLEKKKTVSNDTQSSSEKKKKMPSDSQSSSEIKKKIPSDSESSSEIKKKIPSDSQSSSEKKKTVSSDSESSSEIKKKIPSDSQSSSEKKKKIPSDSQSSSGIKKKVSSDSQSSSGIKKKVSSDSRSSSEIKKKIPSDSQSSSEKKKKIPSDSQSSSGIKKKVSSDSQSSSGIKKKVSSDSEEDPVGKAQGTVKDGSEKEESDRKKEQTVTLRECSIKLERAPSTSVQKLTPERTLPPPAKPSTSSKPPDTVQEEEQKPRAASLDQPMPAAEKSSKKPSSEKKSGSDKRKKAASDYYGERKVKIHRTASEKMLPENLAKERGRRAGKEKPEPAAKLAKSEVVGAEKKATPSGEPSNTKYPCTMCGARFRTESDMKIHISKHLSKQSPKQSGSIESVAKSCLLSSERGSPDRQGFVCKRCGFNARTHADLTKHMWNHPAKPYQCLECGLALSSAETLQNHGKAHAKSKK